MKKLDWYILKRYLGTFFYAIVIMAVISCVITYSERVDDFVKHNAPLKDVLKYFENFAPFIVALLFPLFIFISTIFFTSQLAYKSEIIAILASGIPFQRFLRPYLIGSVIVAGVSLYINHYVVPAANKERLHLEDLYVHSALISSDRNVHLRLTKDLYVYMQSYDYTSNTGYRFTAERIDGTLLKEKLMAERASYDSLKKIWKLFNVTIRYNNGLKEDLRFAAEMQQQYAFTPKDLKSDDDIKQALTTPQLNKFIAKETLRGRENLNTYYVERDQRTSQPFSCIIMTIIGASIASRKVRGGSGLHLAIGIVLSAVYVLLQQFSNTFSIKSALNPLIAVWIPNLIFGIIAAYIYRKQVI